MVSETAIAEGSRRHSGIQAASERSCEALFLEMLKILTIFEKLEAHIANLLQPTFRL